MKTLSLTVCLMIIVITFSFAQSSSDFKNDYNKASRLISLGYYEEALLTLIKVDSISPNNANINYNIGICYLYSILDKTKAIPYLQKAVKNVSVIHEDVYTETSAPVLAFYYLAKAYHADNKLDDAINTFAKFKYYLTGNDAELIKDVDRQIEMCYNAKKLMTNPVDLGIENAGNNVNTKFPEYSPVISANGSTLIFTSRRDDEKGSLRDDLGRLFEDVYIATFNPTDNKWMNARKIGSNINKKERHEASISMSMDGKQLFIYIDKQGGNIYVSNLVNGEWDVPQDLGPEINTKAWETHACLSRDGNTLYFVSNREGGYGGRDIWVSEKLSDGNWSKARNLGPTINTIYEEESPFLSPDGVTMYFSSQGHESMGGFDIFSSTISEDGFWSEPENIGYPINTTDDDVFYVPTMDEKKAYYSSAKLGGYGDKDIYLITIVKEKKHVAVLKGLVLDSASRKPLKAKIEIKDIEQENTIASLSSNEESGKYYVTLPMDKTYRLLVTAEEYIPYYEMFEIPLKEENIIIDKTILLTKSPFGSKEIVIDDEDFNKATTLKKDTIVHKQVAVGERFELKNINFDYNQATLRNEAVPVLDKLVKILKDNPTLRIEVAGHTDNIGSDAYNKKLSLARATVVVAFLIEQGIEDYRLLYKGYGFDLPVATNETDEGRAKNRRTEFIIINK